ncbi:MHS family MFS transporter [Chitinimonas arctica]|uniref:MHS family MFS transporter n=2 Tax=Chitinimonas arctica TaxID=2594795 RepID=A0A516SMG5_9NEIS|nr:MHS family MFS transporter [Chitinimonas arctica]
MNSAALLMPTRHLTRRDSKTLALSALGGALEFYDFIVFVFFAAIIAQLFFPPEMPAWMRQLQTFGIFAAGHLTRPLGGIVMAHFGDLLGRKRMFSLSIFLMAAPTLLIGLLPTYASIGAMAPLLLLALRLLQGAAIGGEVPGAWVFVAEHVPRQYMGLACGFLTCSLTLGILLGSLVATWIHSVYSTAVILDLAWRIPFLLGGVFGMLAVYLRRWLHETPVFLQMQQHKTLAQEIPLRKVLRAHRGSVVRCFLLTGLFSAAILVLILMTPGMLQKLYAVPPAVALQANNLAIVCLTAGCILAGAGADRLGGGRTLLIFCLGLLLSQYWFYSQLAAGVRDFQLNYAVTAFFAGVVGVVPYLMVKAFPPDIRFSGLSLSYNLACAVFGGLTPLFFTVMLDWSPMAPAWYVGTISLLGAIAGLVLMRRHI